MSKKIIKRILLILLALMLLVVLVVGGYILYMQLQYYRIDDNAPLTVENMQTAKLDTGKQYSAVTYNIGFGAYNADYSFFMDTGVMLDGTPVQGKYGRAQSADIVNEDTNGAISVMQQQNADFYLVQEADRDATRSYHIDQTSAIENAFTNYSFSYAQNFHSAFLAYPFNDMHGSVDAGLVTLSAYNVSSAVRRSYPVSTEFFTKFFDLDRCFAVEYIPVENSDKQLVLINSHMSAYDEGGTIRVQQLKLLSDVMQSEYQKGNYVIVGGDFNHVLDMDYDAFECEQQVPDWVAQLTADEVPDNFSIVKADNRTEVATCRGADIPYTKGVNYVAVIDGFIVSDNVTATAENIDSEFKYSDHNPVKLNFTLD